MQSKSSSVPISSLLISPPEERPYESFGHGPQFPTTKPNAESAQQPSSPPVSPWTPASNRVMASTAGRDAADPILFPEGSTSPAQPLFSPSDVGSVIDAHLAARKDKPLPLPTHIKPPTRSEYEVLGPFFRIPTPEWETFAHLKTTHDWAAYQKQQVAEAKADDKARREYRASQAFKDDQRRKQANPPKRALACKHKPSSVGPMRPNSSGGPSKFGSAILDSATGPRNSTKITKPTTSRTGRLTAAPARLNSTPQTEWAHQAKKLIKKSSSKSSKAQVSDTKFSHIPDYCPPLSSLEGKKMEYVSVKTPREFTEADKEYLHLMHPLEQELARREQLSAASYLTSKRRIFVDRLYFYHFEKEQQAEQERLGKKGKPFEKKFLKTHAQEATKIDVNKTSRLHTAFDSVGWLDAKWCEHFGKPTFDNKQDKLFTDEEVQRHGLPGPQKHFKRGVN